jgi:hypothetical protein
MMALRIGQARDRRETSIFRIEDRGDYDLVRMDAGKNNGGGTSDD